MDDVLLGVLDQERKALGNRLISLFCGDCQPDSTTDPKLVEVPRSPPAAVLTGFEADTLRGIDGIFKRGPRRNDRGRGGRASIRDLDALVNDPLGSAAWIDQYCPVPVDLDDVLGLVSRLQAKAKDANLKIRSPR